MYVFSLDGVANGGGYGVQLVQYPEAHLVVQVVRQSAEHERLQTVQYKTRAVEFLHKWTRTS